MLLVIDVGNSNIVLGVYERKKLLAHWRLGTDRERTSDEFGIYFMGFFNHQGLKVEDIEAVIIASVVPQIMYSLEHAVRKYFKHEPMIVGPGIKTGINIKYENPREVGADRIADAVAAHELYGGSLIVIDFGTATTFSAIASKGEFLGGVICPGIKISAEALFQKTAKLPRVELVRTDTVIGKNTAVSIQAGILYGYVGQVNHIVSKMKMEMKDENIRVIATGGLARLIAVESGIIDEINPTLTLEGLRFIFEKNKTEQVDN